MGDKLSQQDIQEMLTECKTIAVVGLSREPETESHQVAAYMKKHGYRIVPVNPFADEILGEKSYRNLLEIPVETQKEIDVVSIFRRAEEIPPIVNQAIKLRQINGKPCLVWMQLGIINEEAAAVAREAGLTVIMDKCIMREHKRFFQHQTRRRAKLQAA